MKELLESRVKIAGALLAFEAQKNWYSKRASDFKSKAQWSSLLIILCGGVTAFIPILKPDPPTHWTEYLVSLLGLVIVVTQGVLRIWRWDQIWPQYRIASERMKREHRMYCYNGGTYPDARDEDLARKQYIDSLEQTIAEEQKIFWQETKKSTVKAAD